MILFSFIAGLISGSAIIMVLMACLSAGAYEKGYKDAKNER